MKLNIMQDASLQPSNSPGDGSIRTHSTHVSSTSGRSYTSTIKYDESFEELRPRVDKLCRILWPLQKSFKNFFLNSQAAAHLRTLKFFGPLVPSAQVPIVERLRGGDYNRITSITLPPSYSVAYHELILRTPRGEEGRPDRDVATLNYVRERTSIPVPSIALQDFTSDNPLGKPYVLQQRIPGTDLNIIWDQLNHSQRCTVARELGGVFRTLLSLMSPISGLIESSLNSTETDIAGCPKVISFELRAEDGELLKGLSQEAAINAEDARPLESTLVFFNTYFSRWRAAALASNCGKVDNEVELYDAMIKVVQEMDERGLFKPDAHCLCHVDLHTRNIMAQVQPDSSLKVTAILDWDEAVFAPKFVACEPPWWLWDDSEHHIGEDGLGTWPYEVEGANDVPFTPERQELKRIFEEHAGPEFVHLAYEAYARFGRGLFRIAKEGMPASHHWKAAVRIVKEWDVLQESLTLRPGSKN